ISNRQPTVICSFFYDIYFIATFWPVLVHPDFTGFGMFCHSLRIAVSVGENCFFGVRFVIIGIVSRDAAIIVQSVNFSAIAGYILRIYFPLPTFSNRKINETFIVKFNARTKMLSGSGVWSSFIKCFN